MDNFEPKKLLILRILQILTEFSDCDHKLRQNDIISLLRIQYGIECERKAIARNIEFLQTAGYDIVADNTGVYLAEKKFETGELRLLIDSVLSNRNICKTHTKELIKKISEEGGKYYIVYHGRDADAPAEGETRTARIREMRVENGKLLLV